jgi:pimeloyl-ACP methyl ester carboxylesterase
MRPELLLIHGAFSQAAHFEPWVDYFRAVGYRATAISLPGRVPFDTEALRRLTFADYGEAVSEAVRRFERPPVVVGHSMGGLLAMNVATRERVAGVVTIAAPMPGRLPTRLGALPYAFPHIPQIIAGRPVMPSPEAVRALVTHHLSTAESEEIISAGGYESGRVLRRLLFGGASVSFHDIRCPVLSLGAGGDRVVPPAAAGQIARASNGEFVVFPEHGHWLIAGSLVSTVAATVAEWLERTSMEKSMG